MGKLTEEQKRLIEDNHNLIYQYMIDRNIDMEYYGHFAEKLCRAISRYDANKSQFSTFVYWIFDNYWKNIKKLEYSSSRYIPLSQRVCIDAEMRDGSGQITNISEIVGKCDEEFIMIEDNDIVNEIRKGIKQYYPNDTITSSVIDYIIKGYNCREVGDIYGVSRQSINARVQKIRKVYEKIKEECE